MKAGHVFAALALCLLASEASAQISLPPGSGGAPPPPITCAATTMYNSIWQRVQGTLRYYELNGIFRTKINQTGCVGIPRVEAWIDGLPGAVMVAGWPVYVNRVAEHVMTDRWAPNGEWHAWSKHWLVSARGWEWVGFDHSAATVQVVPVPSEAELCNMQGPEYNWSGFNCDYNPGSPLIVDVARDGFRLTSVENGAQFDLNGDGLLDRVAWTRRDSDDAFLAMDRNRNGQIDDGTELFGNFTPAFAGQRELTAANGFEALGFLQTREYGFSVADEWMDPRDEAFRHLLLWRDANHNGISEPDELTTAAAAGVGAISLRYREKDRTDRYGNEFRQKGKIVWTDGAVEPIFDVWLQIRF